jgi:hypothetical protein
MNLEKEFVPYQIALDMKSIGFDEECLAGYIYLQGSGTFELAFYKDRNVDFNTTSNIYVSTPMFSQSFKFFRDKYNLRGSIMDFIDDETGIEWDYEISFIGVDLDENGHYKALVPYSTDDESRKFKTYEKAELACLINLIQLVKESKVI